MAPQFEEGKAKKGRRKARKNRDSNRELRPRNEWWVAPSIIERWDIMFLSPSRNRHCISTDFSIQDENSYVYLGREIKIFQSLAVRILIEIFQIGKETNQFWLPIFNKKSWIDCVHSSGQTIFWKSSIFNRQKCGFWTTSFLLVLDGNHQSKRTNSELRWCTGSSASCLSYHTTVLLYEPSMHLFLLIMVRRFERCTVYSR